MQKKKKKQLYANFKKQNSKVKDCFNGGSG